MSSYQYRIRCPICGDSQKDLQDAHCYLKCNDDPSEPILYHCFKCNSGGRVTKWFLDKLGIPESVSNGIQDHRYNKVGWIKTAPIDIITGSPIMKSPQTQYLYDRLGIRFTDKDLDRFKIIWDLDGIKKHVSSQQTLNTFPSNMSSISFLSDDKTTMLTRYISGDDRWKKIPIVRNQNKTFYVIKCTLDLFTPDPIYVNIAEGVIDIISAYANFNDGENSVYIASLGIDYPGAIEYAINKGFVGRNIHVKIYVDSDVDMDRLRRQLKSYKWIFGSITLYRNAMSKDIGVPINNIRLVQSKI